MASSAAERSRAMRARRRLGLGPARKGRPCGAPTSKQHAVLLEAGRISKRRSRAAAAFRLSLAAPPAPAPVLAASTSPPAGATITTPPPAATCPTTSVLLFPTCASPSPPPPPAATSIADALFPSTAAACSPVAFTGRHASAADAFSDVFGADYCSLRALLVRSADAAVCADRVAGAMSASSWTLGGPLPAMRRELGMGGDGFGVVNIGIPAATLQAVAAELPSIVDSLGRVTIFNSTSVETINLAGRDGDHGRSMVPLTLQLLAGCGGAPGLSKVLDAIYRVSRLLSVVFSVLYRPAKPVLSVSSPRANEQMPHCDAFPPCTISDPPRLMGALVAVQDKTRLALWRRSHTDVLAGARCGGGEPFVVRVPVLACVVFRGDLVHCGAANPSPSFNCRVHASLIAGAKRVFDLDGTYPLPKWRDRAVKVFS